MVERVLYGWQPLFIPNDREDNISDLYLPVGHLVYGGTTQELCKVGARSESSDNSYFYGIDLNFIQNSHASDSGGYFEKDTIGGQLQELGAGKVNRSTGKLKVYATDKDGNTISTIGYSESADANTFPLRDSYGNIKVGTPVEDTDAAPKSYVDVLRQSTNPNTANTAGHIGQLCLVGSSDFSPFDVYICVHSENNQFVWHKMCTTEAPS